MRRATITLPDDLESEVEAYLAGQEAPPSLTSLVQAALRRFLEEARRGGRPYPTSGLGEPSEVREPVAAYGTRAPWWAEEAVPGGSGGHGDFTAGRPAARLEDLPDLLASLPRLSDGDAGDFAADLAAAREALDQAGREHGARRPDPWSD